MSTAERLIAQGLERGRAEGKVEGRAEGQVEGRAMLILRLLAARFGPLSDETTTRVRRGSSDDLDRWAVRILDARALADVFDAR